MSRGKLLKLNQLLKIEYFDGEHKNIYKIFYHGKWFF